MRPYKLKVDPHDERDHLYHATTLAQTKFPSKIDLRSKMTPIVDQGQLGSCTANAIASGLKEYLEGNGPRLSRLFLYYHERVLIDTINEDSGAYIRDGMKVLAKIGVSNENVCPYHIDTFTQAPSHEAEVDAASHKISSYKRVTDLNGVKTALLDGLPVVIGMTVYESFESHQVATTGKVPLPAKGEKELGGHAMLIVGYKKINGTEHLIVRNSWGEDWGDNGYCYIPSSFIKRGIINDLWTGR